MIIISVSDVFGSGGMVDGQIQVKIRRDGGEDDNDQICGKPRYIKVRSTDITRAQRGGQDLRIRSENCGNRGVHS